MTEQEPRMAQLAARRGKLVDQLEEARAQGRGLRHLAEQARTVGAPSSTQVIIQHVLGLNIKWQRKLLMVLRTVEQELLDAE